ncbi:MAG: TetR/AcrR family transcriptional regulator [Gemmataceae bacterium]
MSQPPEMRKPGRPKDPERETRRKTEILRVAERAFARDGYARTDVQWIADELGLGKGTIYRYFATKKDLFLAAVDAGLNDLQEAMDAVTLDTTRPLAERFEQVILAYLTFFYERPDLVELFIQERAEFRDRHTPRYFVMAEEDCQGMRFAQELLDAGVLRDFPLPVIMNVIGSLLYGEVLSNQLSGRRRTPAEQSSEILDVLRRGLWHRPVGNTSSQTSE